MRYYYILVFTFLSFVCYTQNNQLQVEADVADGASRAQILEHNIDNGNKGFISLEQHSGSGMNETLGAFITYNSNYNAIPDYHGYVSILSGSTTSEGRGIN